MTTITKRQDFWLDETGALWAPHDRVWRSLNREGFLAPLNYPYGKADARKQFTQSMWRAYGKCQQRANFSYVQRVKPRATAMPLHTGTMTHTVITALMTGALAKTESAIGLVVGHWATNMHHERRELVDDGVFVPWSDDDVEAQAVLIESMAARWLAGWGSTLNEIEVLGTGLHGRVPMRTAGNRRSGFWDFAFEFDGLIRFNGSLWVWELKTTAEGDPDAYANSIEHDPQAWGYSWAASQVFGEPVGICYDALRKKVPSQPKLLVCKKKACSKSRKDDSKPTEETKGCEDCGGTGVIGFGKLGDTTAGLLRAAVNHNSPKLAQFAASDEFRAMVAAATANERRYSHRVWRLPTREYMAAFEREVFAVAREYGKKVRQTEMGQDPWLRMRGNCSVMGMTCPYRSICPSMGNSAMTEFKTIGGTSPVEFDDKQPTGLPF